MRETITELAKAKINLALHVLGRRDDGYHELDSLVAFADFGDHLSVHVADQLSLSCGGPYGAQVPAGDDNIILKAWHVLAALLAARGVVLPPVHFALEKNLPVASGIGGGSADAAAALRGLLRRVGQTLSGSEIAGLAQSLGADVPVCFYGKTCVMRGIGEDIAPVSITLSRAIVLVNPNMACATAAVFSELGLARGQQHLAALDLQDEKNWRNDLTAPALMVQPIIGDVLAALHQEPSFSAVRMSGSGATCFGLVGSMAQASAAAARLSVKHPDWWVQAAELA